MTSLNWTFKGNNSFYSMILLFLLSQIRTLGMLRSRFLTLPIALNACLIPPEKSEANKSSGFRAALSSKFEQV